MITAVVSHAKAAVRFIYDNGNEVSVIWGAGSYTENHNNFREFDQNPDTVVMSQTVEIMIDGPSSKFEQWFKDHYGGENPSGHIPVDEIPKVLAAARRISK